MRVNFKKIIKSYKKSSSDYEHFFKSDHWKRVYKKKKELFKFKNLKNFRNNSLSFGLDTRVGSLDNQKKLYYEIQNKINKEFVNNHLEEKNVGNLKNCLIINDKFIDPNTLFHIDCLFEIIKCTKIIKKKVNLICEIGAGFGSLSRLLANEFINSKIIILDLPEANYLNSYYLLKNFPHKKFLFYSDIKENVLSEKIIKDKDIIIMPPWVKLKNLKVDIYSNVRSFMEMDHKVIEDYFHEIQKNISTDGIFVNINRYDKRTVGYPIRLENYPYDKNWSVITSKQTWNHLNVHTLITKRTNELSNIDKEIKKIRRLRVINNLKINKHLLKNILPHSLFLFIQKTVHYLKNKINK